MTRQVRTTSAPARQHPAHSSRLTRKARSAGTFGVVALLGGALLLPTASVAQAVPVPLPPDDPTVAERWVNPLLRPNESDDQVALELTSIEQGSITPGEELRASFRLRNNSSSPIENLDIRPQRADPINSSAQSRQVLGYESGAYPYYGVSTAVAGTLAPGESREIQVQVPTDPAQPGNLSITAAGVYPVLFAVDGRPEGSFTQQFTTERFLLTVTEPPAPEDPAEDPAQGVPGEAGGEFFGGLPGPSQPPAAPTPGLSMLYPLAAETDVLPGETGDSPHEAPLLVGSEHLATELAEGGRLEQLLTSYQQALSGDAGQSLRAGTCLAIDPALLDTVDRMSRGYTVDDSRPIQPRQSQRLRDSWNDSTDPDPGVPGSGQADAREWLSELQTTAENSCTVALTWDNADLDAVRGTGDQWLMREALERGPETINRILGVAPVSNVVIPGSGYIDPVTAPALGWADNSRTASPSADLTDAWEAETQARQETATAADSGETTPAGDTPTTASQAGPPPVPEQPVRVLVADNSVWQNNQVDRFSDLAPGIRAVGYQGSLAATLAATGINPRTVGYSNPDSRFDYRLDSPLSRDLSAGSSLRLAAAEISAGTADTAEAAEPLFVMPPVELAAGTADMLLGTAADLLVDDAVQPLSFADYLTPNPAQIEELQAAELASPNTNSGFGAPFVDPTPFSDTEILRASQQADYTDGLTRIMTNDPAIALSRYEFTAPLRRDLLHALTVNGRQAIGSHEEAVAATDRRLDSNREMLQSLRSSVSLIPPGNVYTRASDSSPLLIVAQNLLPLPANATITHAGPEDAELNVPEEFRIPAMGSMTLQMTADLPEDRDRTDLTLWLSTSDGAPISEPVDISVQTRAGLFGTSSAAIILVIALALALVFRVGRHRRQAYRRPTPRGQAKPPGAATLPQSRPRRVAPRRGIGRADENSGSPKPPGRS